MNDLARVLVRRGARALSPEELECVSGGLNTLTACTADPEGRSADGDSAIGEC